MSWSQQAVCQTTEAPQQQKRSLSLMTKFYREIETDKFLDFHCHTQTMTWQPLSLTTVTAVTIIITIIIMSYRQT